MTARLALRRCGATVLLWVLLLLVSGSAAAAPASIPALAGRVTDTAGILNREQLAALDQRLAAFEARKGVQLAVLAVPSTRPEPIEQYALRAAEQWRLGRSKVDDGVLLVIARDDRTLRIEVGYGLEGVLNDLTVNRIINETITPRFAQGDFAGGISAGMDRMMAVIEGEPLPPPARPGVSAADEIPSFLPVLVILAVVAAALLRGLMGRVPAALVTGGIVGAAAWFLAGALATALVAAAVAVLFSLAGGAGMLAALGHGRSGWGGHGRGGFRGGGGGFGGGGSSGRW